MLQKRSSRYNNTIILTVREMRDRRSKVRTANKLTARQVFVITYAMVWRAPYRVEISPLWYASASYVLLVLLVMVLRPAWYLGLFWDIFERGWRHGVLAYVTPLGVSRCALISLLLDWPETDSVSGQSNSVHKCFRYTPYLTLLEASCFSQTDVHTNL